MPGTKHNGGDSDGLPQRRRRQTDHPLDTSSHLFEHLLRAYESSDDAILIVDEETATIVDANPRFRTLTGLSDEELSSRNLDDSSFLDRERGGGTLSELIAAEESDGGRRVRLHGRSGSIIDTTLTLRRYELSERRYVCCAFSESTLSSGSSEQKDAMPWESLAAFLHSLPFGCQIIDRSWRYLLVNRAAAGYRGTTPSALLGRTMSECHAGIEGTKLYAAISEVMYDRVLNRLESEIAFSDGSKRSLEYVLYPVATGVLIVSVDLTERGKIEETAASLAAIIESSEQAIIGQTLGDVVTSWNPGAKRLYGYAAEEVIGKPVLSLIPPHHETNLPGILERLRNGQRIPPFETLIPRKDGTTTEVLVSISPIMSRSGTTVAAAAFVLDISDRRKAEIEARVAKERFEMIATTIRNAFWISEPDGSRISYISPAFERIWGRSRASLYENPESFLESVFPEDRERVMRDIQRLSQGQPCDHDFRIQLSDGSIRWINNHGYPILDEKGAVLHLLGIAGDITERKAEEEHSEELARLLDVASDIIVTNDTDMRIRYWNRAAERAFGLTFEQVAGKNVFEVVKPAASPERLGQILDAVYSLGEWTGEMDYSTAKDQKRTMLTRLNLVRNERGEAKAILAVSTDVTDMRSIERQLLRAQRLESLGALASGIAHDLNNILTPIVMATESLGLKSPDEETRRIIDIIRTSADRGARIVGQILGFARGAEGDRAEIQLKHLLAEVESIILQTFPKSIGARFKVQKDLWLVIGDSTQLHQVIMNICVNARDAMSEGGQLSVAAYNQTLDDSYARMRIEAKAMPYVVIEITDTGHGMSPEVLEKIFDPFFTTKAAGKGTGLGLATVHTIVANHGGFINTYSEVGRGTSFKVYLPASQEAGKERREVEEGIPFGNGELVLVADDEGPVREISRDVLQSYGYRVATAADGTDALVVYMREQKEVRVAMIDMMMPYLDGTGTIRALRKLNPSLPVIATSGLLSNEQAIAVRELGANAFLPKPYTAAALLQTLSRVLSGETAGASGLPPST